MLGTPWLWTATATAIIPCTFEKFLQSPDLAGLASDQHNTAKARNKQIGQPYWTESVCLRATINILAKARGQRPQKPGQRAHQHRMPPCCNVLGSLV